MPTQKKKPPKGLTIPMIEFCVSRVYHGQKKNPGNPHKIRVFRDLRTIQVLQLVDAFSLQHVFFNPFSCAVFRFRML